MRPQPKAITRDNPVLIERLFNDVQQALIDGLDWLDLAYGKAERVIQRTQRNERTYIPAWYLDGMDYENLLPDDHKGNYAFFTVEDNMSVEAAQGRPARISGQCSLIVWLDQRTLTNEWGKEHARNSVISILTALNTDSGHLQVQSVFERAESVFSGFTLDEVENQYLTYPYCGFRFVCQYSIRQDCYETGGARRWKY